MPAFLGLGPDNPVAWCNFHRKGGFKTLLTTGGAYLGIIAVLIFLTVRLNPRHAASAYAGWSGFILGLQFLFMVVMGAARVSNTIRTDASSGMLESLRMMPLAPGHAIVGYLTSAAASLAGFFIANLLLGLVVTALAQFPTERWLAANLILLAFAVLVWTIAAFLAFVVKNAGALMVIVSLVGVFGNAGLLYVAPGLLVLAGPLIGGSIFNLRSAQTDVTTPLMMSFTAQFLVGAIFFAGAARKYRRPEALALGARLGVALLLMTIIISLLAILYPEGFRPGFLARSFPNEDQSGAPPFCGSTVLAMLVALVPLCNFARLHVGWVKGRAEDPTLRRTVPPLAPAALMVTAMLALMTFALPTAPTIERAACITAALLGFSLSVTFIAAWFYRSTDNAKVILAFWLIAYCVTPLLVDVAREQVSQHRRFDEPTLRMPATFSPIGLLVESATQPTANLRPAALFHLLIPLLPITLYLRVSHRQRTTRVAAQHAPRPD
jgi:hypothetical protein